MKNSDSLDDLHSIVRRKALRLLVRALDHGIRLIVVSTLRDVELQDYMYSLGRTAAPVREHPEDDLEVTHPVGEFVTHNPGGLSFHNYGCAFDAWPFVYGRLVTTVRPPDWPVWRVLRALCREREINLQWGGSLKLKPREFHHFYYSAGLTAEEMRAGARLPEVEI